MAGCKTPAMVTSPVVHNRDSVVVRDNYIHDSIYTDRWHTIFMKDDTVYKTDSIYFAVYKNVEIRDTISVQHTDTITITVTVEQPMSPGLRFLRNSGIALWGIIAMIVLLTVAVIVIRVMRK